MSASHPSHHDECRPTHSRLFVACGPGGVSGEDLTGFFSAFGEVQHVRCVGDEGVAYVKFALASAAALAIERVAELGDRDVEAEDGRREDRREELPEDADAHTPEDEEDLSRDPDNGHHDARDGGREAGGRTGGDPRASRLARATHSRRREPPAASGGSATCRVMLGGAERSLRVMLADQAWTGAAPAVPKGGVPMPVPVNEPNGGAGVVSIDPDDVPPHSRLFVVCPKGVSQDVLYAAFRDLLADMAARDGKTFRGEEEDDDKDPKEDVEDERKEDEEEEDENQKAEVEGEGEEPAEGGRRDASDDTTPREDDDAPRETEKAEVSTRCLRRVDPRVSPAALESIRVVPHKGVAFAKFNRASVALRCMEAVTATGTLGTLRVKCMLAEPKAAQDAALTAAQERQTAGGTPPPSSPSPRLTRTDSHSPGGSPKRRRGGAPLTAAPPAASTAGGTITHRPPAVPITVAPPGAPPHGRRRPHESPASSVESGQGGKGPTRPRRSPSDRPSDAGRVGRFTSAHGVSHASHQPPAPPMTPMTLVHPPPPIPPPPPPPFPPHLPPHAPPSTQVAVDAGSAGRADGVFLGEAWMTAGAGPMRGTLVFHPEGNVADGGGGGPTHRGSLIGGGAAAGYIRPGPGSDRSPASSGNAAPPPGGAQPHHHPHHHHHSHQPPHLPTLPHHPGVHPLPAPGVGGVVYPVYPPPPPYSLHHAWSPPPMPLPPGTASGMSLSSGGGHVDGQHAVGVPVLFGGQTVGRGDGGAWGFPAPPPAGAQGGPAYPPASPANSGARGSLSGGSGRQGSAGTHTHGAARRVFVVLDKSLDAAALEGAFDQCPGVEAVELKRDGRGRSRGFAYVTFATPAEAVSAAAMLDGSELPLGSGRPMKVMLAEEPGCSGGGSGGGSGRPSGPLGQTVSSGGGGRRGGGGGTGQRRRADLFGGASHRAARHAADRPELGAVVARRRTSGLEDVAGLADVTADVAADAAPGAAPAENDGGGDGGLRRQREEGDDEDVLSWQPPPGKYSRIERSRHGGGGKGGSLPAGGGDGNSGGGSEAESGEEDTEEGPEAASSLRATVRATVSRRRLAAAEAGKAASALGKVTLAGGRSGGSRDGVEETTPSGSGGEEGEAGRESEDDARAAPTRPGAGDDGGEDVAAAMGAVSLAPEPSGGGVPAPAPGRLFFTLALPLPSYAIRHVLTPHGPVVSLDLHRDGASGWVDYAEESGAAAALEALDGTEILGIELRVSRRSFAAPGDGLGTGDGPTGSDQPKKRARTATSGR